MKRCTLIVLVSLMWPVTGAQGQDIDPETGLVIADGWRQVVGNCTECHSAQLITQNAGNKAVWRSRIRWMQDTQGLRELGNELEETILSYLSSHYGEKTPTRRAPLPDELMPENPYPLLTADE